MRLRICLDERYESVARVMNDSPDTHLASGLAMLVIVFQDNYRLFSALALMGYIAGVKVAILARACKPDRCHFGLQAA